MEQEKRPEGEARQPANDNGEETRKPIDPRVLRIAQAIGRQLAREHAKARYPNAANDNKPHR
jgi:hypothetical protein